MVVVVTGVRRVIAGVVWDTGYMSLAEDTSGVKPTDRVPDEQSRKIY